MDVILIDVLPFMNLYFIIFHFISSLSCSLY
nr:MAG TPA: hypothetical protein [Caudoviricetes sp.]